MSNGGPQAIIKCERLPGEAPPAAPQAEGWGPGPFNELAQRLDAAPDWQVHRLPSGHDVMVDMPDAVVAVLLEAAGIKGRDTVKPEQDSGQ